MNGGRIVNVVERFVEAVNRGDLDAIAGCFHPDFEMVVPQHPTRGFHGRDQEVANMRYLLETHPEGRIETRRSVEDGDTVWVQNSYRADGLHIEAVVIYELDRASGTIRVGHYYSDEVDPGGPAIDDWMRGLGAVTGTTGNGADTDT